MSATNNKRPLNSEEAYSSESSEEGDICETVNPSVSPMVVTSARSSNGRNSPVLWTVKAGGSSRVHWNQLAAPAAEEGATTSLFGAGASSSEGSSAAAATLSKSAWGTRSHVFYRARQGERSGGPPQSKTRCDVCKTNLEEGVSYAVCVNCGIVLHEQGCVECQLGNLCAALKGRNPEEEHEVEEEEEEEDSEDEEGSPRYATRNHPATPPPNLMASYEDSGSNSAADGFFGGGADASSFDSVLQLDGAFWHTSGSQANGIHALLLQPDSVEVLLPKLLSDPLLHHEITCLNPALLSYLGRDEVMTHMLDLFHTPRALATPESLTLAQQACHVWVSEQPQILQPLLRSPSHLVSLLRGPSRAKAARDVHPRLASCASRVTGALLHSNASAVLRSLITIPLESVEEMIRGFVRHVGDYSVTSWFVALSSAANAELVRLRESSKAEREDEEEEEEDNEEEEEREEKYERVLRMWCGGFGTAESLVDRLVACAEEEEEFAAINCGEILSGLHARASMLAKHETPEGESAGFEWRRATTRRLARLFPEDAEAAVEAFRRSPRLLESCLTVLRDAVSTCGAYLAEEVSLAGIQLAESGEELPRHVSEAEHLRRARDAMLVETVSTRVLSWLARHVLRVDPPEKEEAPENAAKILLLTSDVILAVVSRGRFSSETVRAVAASGCVPAALTKFFAPEAHALFHAQMDRLLSLLLCGYMRSSSRDPPGAGETGPPPESGGGLMGFDAFVPKRLALLRERTTQQMETTLQALTEIRDGVDLRGLSARVAATLPESSPRPRNAYVGALAETLDAFSVDHEDRLVEGWSEFAKTTLKRMKELHETPLGGHAKSIKELLALTGMSEARIEEKHQSYLQALARQEQANIVSVEIQNHLRAGSNKRSGYSAYDDDEDEDDDEDDDEEDEDEEAALAREEELMRRHGLSRDPVTGGYFSAASRALAQADEERFELVDEDKQLTGWADFAEEEEEEGEEEEETTSNAASGGTWVANWNDDDEDDDDESE